LKKVNEDTFDASMLQGIEKMDLSEARLTCKDIITSTSTRDKKKNALLRDIDSAPSSREISRIMWNVYLAGEGLYTTGSAWQKRF
jgi:ATP phosphoribosyltransferase